MARDYRYGHKVKKPTPRRTQEHDDVQRVVVPTEAAVKVSSSTTKAKKDKKVKIAGSPSSPLPHDAMHSEAPILDGQTERSAEMQKIMDKACRLSSPKTIIKETERKEALDREQAEAALARANLLARQEQEEKKKGRFRWGMWSSAGFLFLMAMLWLWYAPFFLAFAFEMHWIDESTRNQLDPTAVRTQLVASLPQAGQNNERPVANPVTPVAVDSPQEVPVLAYSFYRDLPKANIVVGAQPLPVRTRAPTYLQLASIVNEKEAQTERKRLAQKGYLVQLSVQQVRGQTVHILRMGPYEDQRVINRLKVELQRLGVDAHEVSISTVIKTTEQQTVIPTQTNTVTRAEVQQKITH